MKKQKKCLKCSSEEIRVLRAKPIEMQKGLIPKLLNPYYHICLKCGYAETWIESEAELDYIAKHYTE